MPNPILTIYMASSLLSNHDYHLHISLYIDKISVFCQWMGCKKEGEGMQSGKVKVQFGDVNSPYVLDREYLLFKKCLFFIAS